MARIYGCSNTAKRWQEYTDVLTQQRDDIKIPSQKLNLDSAPCAGF